MKVLACIKNEGRNLESYKRKFLNTVPDNAHPKRLCQSHKLVLWTEQPHAERISSRVSA